MITAVGLKEEAKEIILQALEEARLSWWAAGKYDDNWLRGAEAITQQFISHIEAPAPVNPNYSKMAELAAELIYTSWHHEEELDEVLNVLKTETGQNITVRDIKGLCRIHDFYSSVCDDHDYSIKFSGDVPIIALDDGNNLTPNSLLEALQQYRATLEAGPKP